MSTERLNKFPLADFPGFQRAEKMLIKNGWDNSQSMAKDIFTGFDLPDLGFSPLLGIEDSIVNKGYSTLSKFDLKAWKIPNPEFPAHMWRASVDLDSAHLFEHINMKEVEDSLISWTELSYEVRVRTSGRGSFGDIESYEFCIRESKESSNYVVIALNEIGLKISSESKSELSNKIAQYFRSRPAYLAIFIGKATKETVKVLTQRSLPNLPEKSQRSPEEIFESLSEAQQEACAYLAGTHWQSGVAFDFFTGMGIAIATVEELLQMGLLTKGEDKAFAREWLDQNREEYERIDQARKADIIRYEMTDTERSLVWEYDRLQHYLGSGLGNPLYRLFSEAFGSYILSQMDE